MKINKSSNSLEFEFNKIYITLWQGITEIFTWKNVNWNTYQFINIEFENDIYAGVYVFTFVLLCCGIRVRVPHENKKSKEFWKTIDTRISAIKTWKTIYINEYNFIRIKEKMNCQIETKRPKQFKGYKKCYLQIGE